MDIELLKFGLEEYDPPDSFIPKKKIVLNYKYKLIEKFYEYSRKANKSYKDNNMDDFFLYCVVLLYIKTSYLNDSSEIVCDNFDFIEKEILDLYAEDFKDYLLGFVLK